MIVCIYPAQITRRDHFQRIIHTLISTTILHLSLFLNKIFPLLFRKAQTGAKVPGATGSERSHTLL